MHPTAGNQIDTRIATQVVSGITGAGLIMREQGHATGLRQGNTVETAAVGLALVFGMYIVSTLTAVITFSILVESQFLNRMVEAHYN